LVEAGGCGAIGVVIGTEAVRSATSVGVGVRVTMVVGTGLVELGVTWLADARSAGVDRASRASRLERKPVKAT
jgi:hypothetical protein